MSGCPDLDLLVLYVDDELPTRKSADVASHVDTCGPCRARLGALSSIDAALAEPEPLPIELGARLRTIPGAHPGSRVGRVTAWAAAAAILLAVGAWVLQDDGATRGDRDRTTGAELDAPEPAPERQVRTFPALLALAGHDDAETACDAILSLGDLGRREALPVLVAALDTDDRRAAAIEALARLGNDGAVRALAPFLGEAATHAAVIDALIRIGGTESARVLVEHLESGATSDVGPLVLALARVDGPVGARALAGLLAHRDTEKAVLAAARVHEARLVPHLVEVARGRDEHAAIEALTLLEHLHAANAVSALSVLLGDRHRRGAAARVLARIDTPAAAAALFEAAGHDDVRAAFQRAGPVTEAWLCDRLGDRRRQTRRNAIDLLARCGGPESVPVLVEVVADRALAPIAIAAIGRIGGPAAVDALDALASDPRLLSQVVVALGATGAHRAVAILERIGQRERTQRAPAIEALARVPHADAVGAILRLDGGRHLRSRTTRALLVMDRDVVTSALTALLDSEHAPRARVALDAVHRADARSAP